MRTLVVEDFDELIEAGLLLQEVASGGLGGFFFQGEVHALMATVLLGLAGLDPFNANTQAEPPDRQLAQMKQGVGGREGHAIIAADVGGQATLLEKSLKHGKGILFPGGRKSFAGEKKTD